MTIQEAALLYEVDGMAIALALEALGKDVTRRMEREANGTIKTLYRRSEIEDALSRVYAQTLGFDDS